MALKTLQKLHLSPDELSVTTRKSLQEASQCEQFKSIGQHPIKKTVRDACAAVEAAKLAMQESTIRRRIRAVTKSDSDLREQMAVFRREFELVQDEYNTLKATTDEKVCAASACNLKAEKTEQFLKQLKEEMTINGIPDKQKYKTVLENYEALKASRNEIVQLREEISKYEGLPPNLEEASMVLLQAKQEHEQLMKQISNKVQSANIYL